MSGIRQLQSKVFQILDPAFSRLGVELVAVEMTGEGGRRILRVSVDRPGGLGMDDLATLSRAISPLLDAEDPIEGAYTLEVSSPGIERPVQRPEDFERFVGFRIKIRLEPGHPRRRFSGVLKSVQDGQARVDVDGTDFDVPIDLIEKANLDLTLDEYQQLAEDPPPRVPPKNGGLS